MLEQQPAASMTEVVDRKTILIVEDDSATGFMLVSVIEQTTPYHTLLVKSSTEALRVVQENTPDLFLLDYYLAGMNGLTLYDRLQSTHGLETVPAVLMSAGTLPLEREQEITDHQIVFLRKPFDLDELLETIEHLLS
jgi:CheY-like chemotaxis protein